MVNTLNHVKNKKISAECGGHAGEESVQVDCGGHAWEESVQVDNLKDMLWRSQCR